MVAPCGAVIFLFLRNGQDLFTCPDFFLSRDARIFVRKSDYGIIPNSALPSLLPITNYPACLAPSILVPSFSGYATGVFPLFYGSRFGPDPNAWGQTPERIRRLDLGERSRSGGCAPFRRGTWKLPKGGDWRNFASEGKPVVCAWEVGLHERFRRELQPSPMSRPLRSVARPLMWRRFQPM